MPGAIFFLRKKELLDEDTVEILLDGRVVGIVDSGQWKRLDYIESSVELQIRVDNCYSNRLFYSSINPIVAIVQMALISDQRAIASRIMSGGEIFNLQNSHIEEDITNNEEFEIVCEFFSKQCKKELKL